LKLALKAVAKLANVNMSEAANTIRRHPLLEEEIHIEEELINLQEALNSSEIASETLHRYPAVRKHIIAEQRAILKHSIGMIDRMLQNRRLPRQYTQQDVQFSMRKLIRLLVGEAHRVNKEIDEDILEIIKPHLSWRQRLSYVSLPLPLSPLSFVFRKLAT
jgi:hypothetical protein